VPASSAATLATTPRCARRRRGFATTVRIYPTTTLYTLTKHRQAARPRVERMPASPHHREYVTRSHSPSCARDAPHKKSWTDKRTAKQCYHCQGLGHVQADCPTLRLSGAGTSGRCYSCGLAGHLARNCPNPGMGRGAGGPPRGGGFGGGFRGGFAGGARAATCYKCGGPNHFARDCQAQAMKW
jgi:hypothetical protein